MDASPKSDSRWLCLQLLDGLHEQCRIISEVIDAKDHQKEKLLPLILSIKNTAHSIGLLRQDYLLNEAHVLTRLLTERVINLCYLLVADSSEVEKVTEIRKSSSENSTSGPTADDLISSAKKFQFFEKYDSEELERKLKVLESKTKLGSNGFRFVIASHYPIASEAMSGSLFGASCHIRPCGETPPEDFFKKEFSTLLLSCCWLLNATITTIAENRQIPTLTKQAEEVMKIIKSAVALGLNRKAPDKEQNNIIEGFWSSLTDFEHIAAKRLQDELRIYDKEFCRCAEAGMQVTALPHSHRGSLRLKLSALFLKRILNDLRGVWLLLKSGYTSQAAAIAASLYENALAVQCIADNDKRALDLEKSTSGALPWNIAMMCKFVTGDEKNKKQDYDKIWKSLYGQYAWLCEIKHPTLHQSIYDAGATSVESTYAVIPFPDIRDDNLGTKIQICLIVLFSAQCAIRAFAEGADVQRDSEETKLFEVRSKEAFQFIEDQLKDKNHISMPFAIKDTHWGKKNLR
jgi:hypothetical protein